MSLKGYYFYNEDNTKLEAMFFFKNQVLTLLERVSEDRINEMKTYIKEHISMEVIKVEYWGC